MKRTIVAFALTCALIITSFTTSFAQISVTEGIHVQPSYAVLEQAGLVKNYSRKNNVETYDVEFESGILSNFNVETFINGDRKYSIIEGNLSNEVIVKSDGTIYLDGFEVIIEEMEPLNTDNQSMKPITGFSDLDVLNNCSKDQIDYLTPPEA